MHMERKPTEISSLVSPPNRGGVVGGGGYDFQAMYLCTQVPIWLADESFVQVVQEGVDDIDVRLLAQGENQYGLLQVKGHQVTPAGFKAVLSRFAAVDEDAGGAFASFTLACPSVSSDLEGLCCKLDECRSMSQMYPETHPIGSSTLDDLQQQAQRLGLGVDARFLVRKVHIDRAVPGLGTEGVSRALFTDRMRRLPRWTEASVEGLDLAYEGLVTLIFESRRRPLAREDIESLLDARIASSGGTAQEPASTVHLHNWSVGPYDYPPDFTLDWSQHFDRSSRRVPEYRVWQGELLPALEAAERAWAQSARPKLIRLRASACLSSGLAFGRYFAEVASYVIELQQKGQVWRSDAEPEGSYELKIVTEDGSDPNSEDILVAIGITADPWRDVARYVEEIGLCYQAAVRIYPRAGVGESALASAGQAISFAVQVKQAIRTARNCYDVRGANHLFLNGPIGFAVFLGQKLRSAGEFQCYEYRNTGYSPSCRLPA